MVDRTIKSNGSVGGSGMVFWIFTRKNMTLPPSQSPSYERKSGVNTAPLGGGLHSSKTRARWAEGFHDELYSHKFDKEKDPAIIQRKMEETGREVICGAPTTPSPPPPC